MNNRIGMTIQDNVLVICEITEGINESKEINSLNVLEVPEKVIKQGIIQDKKALKKIILDALATATPSSIDGKEVFFEVPEEHVFQHVLTLPSSLSEKQMREAMIFEAEKLLPFEIDQMSWDIKIISTQNKASSILFTAVPLDLVQEYYDLFISCGLVPLGFSVRAEDLLHIVGRNKLGLTILLDLQKEYTGVLFFDGDKLLAIEQINIGENELRKAIKTQFELTDENVSKEMGSISSLDVNIATLNIMKKFEEELKLLVKGFSKIEESYKNSLSRADALPEQKNSILERVKVKTKDKTADTKASKSVISGKPWELSSKYELLFTGTGYFHATFREYFKESRSPKLKAIKTSLKQVLNLQTRDQNRLSFFSKSEDKPVFKKLIPGALGAALMNYTVKNNELNAINLLPPMVRTFALWKKNGSWIILLASFILMFSIAWLMLFGFSWGSTVAQLKIAKTNFISVERQLSVRKSQSSEERIKAANEELKVLTELKKSGTPYADIVDAIGAAVPDVVHFVSLRYGLYKDKTLFEWKGLAPGRGDIIDANMAIKSLPFIRETIFPPSNLDKKDQIEFTILFHLKEGIKI